MANDKKINENIERLQLTGTPGKIISAITSRMHPEGATLPVEAYGVPSAYFAAGGSHTYLVALDRSLSWGNAGRGWWDIAGGEDKKRVRVARQDAYYDWLMAFSPPYNDNFWKTGINFGFNGVCHTITNRQLLLGEKFVTVFSAQKAYLTTAFFGLYGMGLEDLRNRLTESYNATQHLTKLPEGTLEKVLAKINYDVSIDVYAWSRTLEDVSKIPIGPIAIFNPQVNDLLKVRIATYRQAAEATYVKAMDEKWEQAQYRTAIADLIISLNDGFVGDLLKEELITSDEAKTYIDNGTYAILRMMSNAQAQHQLVAEIGAIDDELANKLGNV